MRNLVFILFTISFAAFISYAAKQHSVSMNGSQSRENKISNAALQCSGITISSAMKIVEINGENAGFWITKGSSTIKKYFIKNDPNAIGYLLNPGTYYVYPNFPTNINNATVNLVLK